MYPWWRLNHFDLCRWINHQVVDSLREGALGYVCVCLCTDTGEGRPSNPGRAWNSLDPDTWSVLCWNARLDSRLISQHKNMWKKTGSWAQKWMTINLGDALLDQRTHRLTPLEHSSSPVQSKIEIKSVACLQLGSRKCTRERLQHRLSCTSTMKLSGHVLP